MSAGHESPAHVAWRVEEALESARAALRQTGLAAWETPVHSIYWAIHRSNDELRAVISQLERVKRALDAAIDLEEGPVPDESTPISVTGWNVHRRFPRPAPLVPDRPPPGPLAPPRPPGHNPVG